MPFVNCASKQSRPFSSFSRPCAATRQLSDNTRAHEHRKTSHPAPQFPIIEGAQGWRNPIRSPTAARIQGYRSHRISPSIRARSWRLLGPSGFLAKSTLLRMLTGLSPGQRRLRSTGTAIRSVTNRPKRFHRSFKSFALFSPWLTVLEKNVEGPRSRGPAGMPPIETPQNAPCASLTPSGLDGFENRLPQGTFPVE